MSEEEKKAVEELKQELESTIRANDCGLSNNDFKKEINTYTTVLNLIENQQKEIEKLKNKIKEANKYIEEEMDIVDNPTICGEESDSLIELPISLSLYNEDLRKLLELLEEG